MEAGDVRPCAVQSPLEFVSFTQKLVPLGKKELVLLAETVAIFLDPSAVRLSQLSEQVSDELTLSGKLPTEVARFGFGIECALPPRRFLLGGSPLDQFHSSGVGPWVRRSDHLVDVHPVDLLVRLDAGV